MDMDCLLLENRYQLTWNEYGNADGEPVLYFHGTPGSRLEAFPADVIAHELGIRLIVPDRPGYGASDSQYQLGLSHWPKLVCKLVNKLKLDKFSIIGYSSGGAYALSCADKIPHRINNIALVSSTAPFEKQALRNQTDAIFKPLYDLSVTDSGNDQHKLLQLATSPKALMNALKTTLPPADKALFKNLTFQKYFLMNLSLAITSGVDGIVNDIRNLSLPWDIELEDIELPVDIWHGRDDNNLDFSIAEYLAHTLKNSSTHFLDKAGHYFIFDQWREVLEQIKTQGFEYREAESI